MTLKPCITTKFDKEVEVARKRGKDMSKIGDIINENYFRKNRHPFRPV